MKVQERQKLRAETNGDVICPACNQRFFYDEGRRCWSCDSLACPECMPPGDKPLCDECISQTPEQLEPMFASLGKLPANPEQWGYEFKWDGIRAICYSNGKKIRIDSRNLIDITYRYPEFYDLAKALGGRSAVLDGEIVALDRKGRPDFNLLTRRMHLNESKVERISRQVPIMYFVFDLLHLDGRSTLRLPYKERRLLLESLGLKHRRLRIPPSLDCEPEMVFETAKEHKLEGIVAKKLDSTYEPGARSKNWIKIKIELGQEFVIGGWTPERGNENRIGALLIGYYDEGMGLRYAGSVGTGFSDVTHTMLVAKLRSLETKRNPFVDADVKRGAYFVRPVLVADIQYRRWPKDGSVQQASFKGIRIDKSAGEVHRESEGGEGGDA